MSNGSILFFLYPGGLRVVREVHKNSLLSRFNTYPVKRIVAKRTLGEEPAKFSSCRRRSLSRSNYISTVVTSANELESRFFLGGFTFLKERQYTGRVETQRDISYVFIQNVWFS